MKISYAWLKEYLSLDLPPEDLSEILTAIGLEVGGLETIESIRGGLNGIIAGRVEACGKHPNADRLSLCQVDVGDGKLLQIVCGAPNVAGGQTVWVAQIGTTLYPSGSEKTLTIKRAKVRGEFSEGMICAEDELGIGDDHSGILVLPQTVNTGTLARDYYNVTEDVVFDIDLTPNRSDATSHLGVAEDVAAFLKINTGKASIVAWPDTGEYPALGRTPITVEVINSEACPRYAALVLEGVKVTQSPDWLKQRLTAIGVRPINNIVDVTNFVLYEMGQPLHAFDADQIKGNHVIVKTLDEGSSFVTLDEVERTLSATDLMICNGEGTGMCMAGVFGGLGTGVTEGTSRLFLESAHFNAEWIRRTSMNHLLRTDAARTFEKTTDPNVCVIALKRAADLIVGLAGGEVVSDIIDHYPDPVKPRTVLVRWAQINKLIGVQIPQETILRILNALNMEIVTQDDKGFQVAVPTNKADVTREADVIEEILRIYGFNNVPLHPRMEVALTSVKQPTLYKVRNALGALLSSLGFCEMMGMSMTETRRFENGVMQLPMDQMVIIENTSNISLCLMRPNLLVTALEMAQYNQNRQQENFRTYEFGNAYRRDGKDIVEKEFLTLVISGAEFPRNWRSAPEATTDFYVLKKYVQAVLDRVGLKRYQLTEMKDKRFIYGLRYHLGDHVIVEFGSLSKDLRDQFDLRSELLYAEFSMQMLFSTFGKQEISIDQISKYPGTTRDLAFDLPLSVQYADLERIIRKCDQKLLQDVELFDVYENPEQLGHGRKSYAVQLIFEDLERTLTDSDVDQTISKIVQSVGAKLDGKQR